MDFSARSLDASASPTASTAAAPSRLVRTLDAVFLLQPSSFAFFLTLALLHVVFKVTLGLMLVTKDHYGWLTLVAPPFSLLLSLGDIGVAYLLAKLVEWTTPKRAVPLTQSTLLVLSLIWLGVNFIVHTYCKSFVNYGLLQFNGAGFQELVNYSIGVVSLPFGLFVLFSLLSLAVFFLWRERLTRWFVALGGTAPKTTFIVLVLSLALCFGIISRFTSGIKGWLVPNPLSDLVFTTVQAGLAANSDATEDLFGSLQQRPDLAAFQPPQAYLYGAPETNTQAVLPRPLPIKTPNVLFIITESLPYEMTPLSGNTDSPLTVLSDWRTRAVEFSRFYTVFPATSRSFIAYHCSLPPNPGLKTITKLDPGFDCPSITSLLHEKGYRTGFFTASIFSYDNMNSSRFMKNAYEVNRDFFSLREKAKLGGVFDQAVEEEAAVDALFDFMTEARDKPFFATYFPFWDHAPYTLPFEDIRHLPLLERYNKTLAYLNQVFIDLYKRLETEGLLENTILVFTADHGEGLATHHKDNLNHMIGHLYQQNIRIPFLLLAPGMTEGQRSDRLATNLDFAPTLFGLLGMAPPASWQGRDLLAETWTPRPIHFVSRAQSRANGLIDGNWKYFFFEDRELERLFDLSSDPHEQLDQSLQRPDQTRRYRELAATWALYNGTFYERKP